MRAQLAYLRYVLAHKWYVLLACLRLGVPIHQAIIHDWVKFLPIEWGAYVRQFYNSDGSKRQVRDATGAYDPNAQPDDFRRAWLHHQRQPHHWQAWCVVGDGGSVAPLRMPRRFAREMVADWIGAARANGAGARPDTEGWFLANHRKMVLHDSTRYLVTQLIKEAQRKGIIA